MCEACAECSFVVDLFFFLKGRFDQGHVPRNIGTRDAGVPASSTASEVERKEGRHGSKEAEGYRVDRNDGTA